MVTAVVRLAAAAQPPRVEGNADHDSDCQVQSVRGLDVILTGELAVVCEIAWLSWRANAGPLAVHVVFPEDVRGLFQLLSWGGIGGIADAMTQIAVGYLSCAVASGALEARNAHSEAADGRDGVFRVDVSSLYVRVALTELTSH